jgi:hypothetical protein
MTDDRAGSPAPHDRVGSPTPRVPHVRWAKGGEAWVASLAADAVVLRSTVPSPPGSRIEGALEGEPPATVRVKVHASRLQPEGDFVIEGRLLDVTRAVRARLLVLAG